MSAALRPDFDRLTPFETAFIDTVLEHRGIYRPSPAEYDGALDVLRRYDQQCLANPGWEQVFSPRIDSDELPAVRAKAFMMFGVISPSPAQWHKAHVALFGPLLCETCG
jgi:hypothetical protein